jgi:hypothetical protein
MVSEFDLALSNDIASKIESFGNEFQYVVYTALFGEVDELHDPVGIENDNALFICFTDRTDIKSDIWNIVDIEGSFDNSRISAKYWKFFGYRSFTKQAKITIWVDASLKIINSLMPLSQEMLENTQGASILTFHHPQRSCAYSEFFWIFAQGQESIKSLVRTWFFLKKNRNMCGNGLINGTVLIRKYFVEEENKLDKLMLEWWRCINTYSSRDQLTFNFLVSRKEFNGIHNYLNSNDNVFDCNYFRGVRDVRFNSQINPGSKINLRHKVFYLVSITKKYFKKNRDNR